MGGFNGFYGNGLIVGGFNGFCGKIFCRKSSQFVETAVLTLEVDNSKAVTSS